MDFRLQTPCRILISGPSASGKTTLILQLIDHRRLLFSHPPEKIFYFYGEWNSIFTSYIENNEDISFHQGIPTVEHIKKLASPVRQRGSLLVIDDAMGNIKDPQFPSLFTMVSHHYNITICILLQNLFPPEHLYRTISINCNYFFIMKNPRNGAQFGYFVRQLAASGKSARYYSDVFHYVTKEPYTYVMLDLSQHVSDRYRVRSNFIPVKGKPMSVYFPI